MRAVLDALGRAFGLSLIPWMLVMVSTSACMAHRLGWRAGYGALLGFIPIPFVSWIIVFAVAGRPEGNGHVVAPVANSRASTIDDDLGDRI
jgi:hypothetical protein